MSNFWTQTAERALRCAQSISEDIRKIQQQTAQPTPLEPAVGTINTGMTQEQFQATVEAITNALVNGDYKTLHIKGAAIPRETGTMLFHLIVKKDEEEKDL